MQPQEQCYQCPSGCVAFSGVQTIRLPLFVVVHVCPVFVVVHVCPVFVVVHVCPVFVVVHVCPVFVVVHVCPDVDACGCTRGLYSVQTP